MADYYVSSVAYAAVPTWAATTAYTVGQFVKRVTPGVSNRYVHRCTTAGTSGASEPTWSTVYGNTTTSGTAVFTNETSLAANGWSAAAGNLLTIAATGGTNRPVAGDRVFLSSDHVEGSTGATYGFNAGTVGFGLIQFISVNRAGSVPPVTADILSGATLNSTSGSLTLDAYCNNLWQGVTVSAFISILFGSSSNRAQYFKDCALQLATNSGGIIAGNAVCRIVLDNTTMQFGNIAQGVKLGNATPFELVWLNTPSAIVGATIPTNLFANSTNASQLMVTCRGVDLSAINTTLVISNTIAHMQKFLFDSCKINSAVVRYGTPAAGSVPHDEIELVNCHNGTSTIHERHTAAGDITTDTTTYISPATYSMKLASSSRSDRSTLTLDNFWIDVQNTATGSSKTATVEIVSSASLNDNDISLLLEYMGTSGNSVASFVSSLPSPLATPAALATSSATWTSPPATPVKQKLTVAFTPQRAGRVRGLVKLGKPSTTCWIDPKITVA